ncbi:hypothetical protein Q8G71_35450, partial [Klebsiella pneumoniae]
MQIRESRRIIISFIGIFSNNLELPPKSFCFSYYKTVRTTTKGLYGKMGATTNLTSFMLTFPELGKSFFYFPKVPGELHSF